MTPHDLRHRPVTRRCALFGASGVGAAALLSACTSGSGGSSTSPSGAPSSAGTTGGSTASDTTSSTAPTTSGSPSSGGASPSGDVIAALSDIPVGGTTSVQVDGQAVLLSQPEAGTVEAFSAVCPHQGGQVQPNGQAYRCTLHFSEFDIDGAVTKGPARKDLTAIAVAVSGDDVVKA